MQILHPFCQHYKALTIYSDRSAIILCNYTFPQPFQANHDTCSFLAFLHCQGLYQSNVVTSAFIENTYLTLLHPNFYGKIANTLPHTSTTFQFHNSLALLPLTILISLSVSNVYLAIMNDELYFSYLILVKSSHISNLPVTLKTKHTNAALDIHGNQYIQKR